jgi:lipid-A-disaccharide synthase
VFTSSRVKPTQVIAASNMVLTASGTATVQTCPARQTDGGRLSRVAARYRIGRPFVRLDTFAMVNLIAGERIVPELIQDAFTPKRSRGKRYRS